MFDFILFFYHTNNFAVNHEVVGFVKENGFVGLFGFRDQQFLSVSVNDELFEVGAPVYDG